MLNCDITSIWIEESNLEKRLFFMHVVLEALLERSIIFFKYGSSHMFGRSCLALNQQNRSFLQLVLHIIWVV